MQGSKLTKNSSHNFVTGYQNLVAIQQNLRTAFPVSGLAKQNMSPQFLCVKETAENGECLKDETVPVFNTTFERSNIFRLKENS